jgi:hypothetical protein
MPELPTETKTPKPVAASSRYQVRTPPSRGMITDVKLMLLALGAAALFAVSAIVPSSA